jgi:CheY-like chemotaxis protein
MLTRLGFEEAGMEVDFTVARDGREALEHLLHDEVGSDHVFDVIVLDLDLPQINGYDVLREISASEQLHSIPVIILSGSVIAEATLGEYRRQVVGVLSKPFDADGYTEIAREIADAVVNRASV